MAFPPRLPHRDVLLIDPDLSVENDPILKSVDREEELGNSVKAGGIGIHVGFRRRGGTVELEYVVQELDGLGDGYLLGIEDGSGQRSELAAAVWVQAFVDADSRPFAESVLSESGRSAMGARFRDDRVDERDFLFRPAPVLFPEPFGDGLVGERAKLVGFRRKRRFGGLGLAFLHIWRFRQKKGRRPKPPSFEKAPAHLRALDAGSLGPTPPLYSDYAIYPLRAN